MFERIIAIQCFFVDTNERCDFVGYGRAVFFTSDVLLWNVGVEFTKNIFRKIS